MLKSTVGIVLLAILVAAAVAGFACLKLGLSMSADALGVDMAWPSMTIARPQNARVDANASADPEMTYISIPVPKNGPYTVAVSRDQTKELDGYWLVPRAFTGKEKLALRLVLEAAKNGDAIHLPFPIPEESDEKK